MKKIALIPIDNRPVCYTLPEQIAKIDDELKLFLPDRALLGGLNFEADVDGILDWLENLEDVDAIIISLDTIAYGGLISSRRCNLSLDEIKNRIEKIKEILLEKCTRVYAFSSIMRISNNNVNEEEKEYWSEYGKKIFEYSYNFHQDGIEETDQIPEEILQDYFKTRERNFEVNKTYLDWVKDGILDSLVFSKDDCAKFGFNVLEAQELEKLIKEKNLPALVKTGADEIPLTLFARAINSLNGLLRVSPLFLAPKHKDLISNYEDISIEKSVNAQLELAGCEITSNKMADIILMVNNFEEKQGEIVMGVDTKAFSGNLKCPEKKFMVADVRFANGADEAFVAKLFETCTEDGSLNIENFYGYSAWNTSANTLGSLICAGVVRYFAKKYNEKAFKELQMVRFLDDWAYQAKVRQALKKLSKEPNLFHVKTLMLAFENQLEKIIGVDTKFEYNFPWDRFFEIAVVVCASSKIGLCPSAELKPIGSDVRADGESSTGAKIAVAECGRSKDYNSSISPLKPVVFEEDEGNLIEKTEPAKKSDYIGFFAKRNKEAIAKVETVIADTEAIEEIRKPEPNKEESKLEKNIDKKPKRIRHGKKVEDNAKEVAEFIEEVAEEIFVIQPEENVLASATEFLKLKELETTEVEKTGPRPTPAKVIKPESKKNEDLSPVSGLEAIYGDPETSMAKVLKIALKTLKKKK
jgi:hypothetical protein